MKTTFLLLALGLVCLAAAAPSHKVEKRSLSAGALRKLTDFLKKELGDESSGSNESNESKESSEEFDFPEDAPNAVKLMVLEHVFRELLETDPGFKELMANITSRSAEAVEGLAPQEILPLIPDAVETIYQVVTAYFGSDMPSDISAEDLKLFIKLRFAMDTVLPYVESRFEGDETEVVAAFGEVLADFDVSAIERPEDFEAAFIAANTVLIGKLQNVINNVPAELEPVKDLLAPIIGFHLRVEMVRILLKVSVPGIEEELGSAVWTALKAGKRPLNMYLYVVHRVGAFIQFFGPPGLAESLENSLECEEIIKQTFEYVAEHLYGDGEKKAAMTKSTRGMGKVTFGLKKMIRSKQ